jgi:hypothetical protein
VNYTKAMGAFARYVKADGANPARYYALCCQLLGCAEVLPSAVKTILVEQEGLDEDATTYHEAAISGLTEYVIDGEDPSVWREALMPLYKADMAYTRGTVSAEGFRAWLTGMVDEDDLIEALGE